MPWTFWNLLILTVGCSTRPHQGKQLLSQNNKLLNRVYLRIAYFPKLFSKPFPHSVCRFWTTEWHTVPGCKQPSTLGDSLKSTSLSSVLSFETSKTLAKMVLFLTAVSSQHGFASCRSGESASKEILFFGAFWPKLLILLNFCSWFTLIMMQTLLISYVSAPQPQQLPIQSPFSQSVYIPTTV